MSIDFGDYHSFTFEEDGHRYLDAGGVQHLSITQMLSLAGIYDFSMVKPEVLENARRRGSNVHRWCAEYDLHGYVDPDWMAEDEVPYVEAWMQFKRDSGLIIRKVETPMLRPINGFLVGGTPDVEGLIGPNPFVVERKACSAKHPGWGIQTALQEMLITGKPRVGHMGRASVQLKPNGRYTTHFYEDPTDADVALAIVAKFASEQSIKNWLKNNNLTAA
jgi:hypothetical protein